MTAITDYANYDTVGLADLIAKGEVTPEEALDAALTRMRAVQPELNAVVHDMEDEARRTIAAGLPDRPFRGVPFMLKDLNLSTPGSRRARARASTRASCPGTTASWWCATRRPASSS